MLAVIINRPQFEYDIHSLVKAFYPSETVKVFGKGEKEFVSDGKNPQIHITFEDACIRMQLGSKNGEDWHWQEQTVTLTTAEERSEVKNRLKQLIYQMLTSYTGRQLPWGTLTGIRPAKLAMSLLEKGLSETEISRYMKETYYISDEKLRLGMEIARREKELLSQIHQENGYSLYIGIPFCPTTCLYCSFTSYPICAFRERVSDYLTSMEKEIDFVSQAYRGKYLDSVYIGGGTPTTLEAGELDRLLSHIRRKLDFSHVLEFTVEAGRADSITEEKLQVLFRHQVTRISVNPQTMKQDTLDIIGRKHTVAQVKDAFRLARETGFTNINMDLILGLPGENEADVAATMEAVKELQPDSLTVHSLAVKRASRLNLWIEENGISTLKNTDETMRIAAAGAKEMDMVPYYLYRQKNMSGNFENVGYAKEGKFGIYNVLIMEEKQTIVAIGAGSISKLVLPGGRIERCDSVKDVGLYIERTDEMIARKQKLFSLENRDL